MGKTAGRQPLPKAERRSERIFVYVTPAEYRAVKTHRKRGQTISDFVRDAIVAACRPVPKPSPPAEVASTPLTPAAVARESERATAPQANPPAAPMAAQGGARMPGGPLIPAPVAAPPEPAPPPPQKRPRADLVAEAVAFLRNYRGKPILAKRAYEIAERDPQLVLDVGREAKVAWLSHRDLWFLLKERAGE